jgi:hypothetical protein
MADKKISQLLVTNPAAALTGPEGFHGIQGSPFASVGVTADQIKNFVMSAALANDGDTGVGVYSFLAASHTPQAGAAGTSFIVSSESTSTRILYDNYNSSAGGANVTFRKARGNAAAPSALALNDQLINIAAFGYGTSAYSAGTRAGIVVIANEAWTDTAHGTYMYFHSTTVGGTTNIQHLILTDGHVRLGTTNNVDLQMGGANTVITSERHFRLRSYTMGTLPSGAAGDMIYVSDGPSRARLAISNGTSWYFPDGPLTENEQTAAYTLILADERSRHIKMNVAGAHNLTVPPNSSVAFAIGSVINVTQMGAGQTTFNPGVGVTLRSSNGLKLRAQYSMATHTKINTDEWLVSGDTTT